MSATPSNGLFATLLGPSFEELSPAVRAVHCGRPIRLEGTASVTRGPSLAARLLCRLMRLPRGQRDAPVMVMLDANEEGEIWSRWYGASEVMRSRVERRRSLLVERFGPTALHFRLAARSGDLEWMLARVTVFGAPLPKRMFRGIGAKACDKGGRYAFAVSVTLPLVGHVISYEGVADVVD